MQAASISLAGCRLVQAAAARLGDGTTAGQPGRLPRVPARLSELRLGRRHLQCWASNLVPQLRNFGVLTGKRPKSGTLMPQNVEASIREKLQGVSWR